MVAQTSGELASIALLLSKQFIPLLDPPQTDAINILGFLFQGTAIPTCMEAADADNNDQVQLTDAVRILGFLFQGSAAPVDPGPVACGPDPDGDSDTLDCGEFLSCE